ncbi:MAG TPA: CopG family ribbon-helix-helix protein, partial [Thermoplasmata archaeon]
YPSRSEAFREALRDFIDEAEWSHESGTSTLILVAVVDKEATKADLVTIQHRFAEIRTRLHTHLDERNCLEIFVAEGPSGRLKEFVQRLRRVKGVSAIKFISTSPRV